MSSPAFNRVEPVLMNTSGFQVVQVGDDAIRITRSYRRYVIKSLLGLFVSCWMGGLGYLALTSNNGLLEFLPGQVIGAVMMLFCSIAGIGSLLGVIGLARESWFVTRNIVRYSDGFAGLGFRRQAVDRVVEMRKDTKTGQRQFYASKAPGTHHFWDQLPFDLHGSPEDIDKLGHLVAQFTGWAFVEIEMDMSTPSGGGGVGAVNKA